MLVLKYDGIDYVGYFFGYKSLRLKSFIGYKSKVVERMVKVGKLTTPCFFDTVLCYVGYL